MAKFLIPVFFAILAWTFASEDAEVIDLQPAGTFGVGLGLGGLGLGWNPKRIIIPKTFGWDSGYVPPIIDGGHHHHHYPSFGYEEIPVKSYSYGWGEQAYPSFGYNNYIADSGPGWGWDGAGLYGGLGPY